MIERTPKERISDAITKDIQKLRAQQAMWTALEAHQPVADRRGYGTEWARMCSKRTEKAAYAAADAARVAVAAFAALYASRAVDPDYAARANEFTKLAIDYITEANQEEQA